MAGGGGGGYFNIDFKKIDKMLEKAEKQRERKELKVQKKEQFKVKVLSMCNKSIKK